VNQAVLTLRAAETAVEASRRGVDQAAVTRARFNAVNALAEYQSAAAMWLRATGPAR
jgi:hypothetical protein